MNLKIITNHWIPVMWNRFGRKRLLVSNFWENIKLVNFQTNSNLFMQKAPYLHVKSGKITNKQREIMAIKWQISMRTCWKCKLERNSDAQAIRNSYWIWGECRRDLLIAESRSSALQWNGPARRPKGVEPNQQKSPPNKWSRFLVVLKRVQDLGSKRSV
jgi:hypothetical protein